METRDGVFVVAGEQPATCGSKLKMHQEVAKWAMGGYFLHAFFDETDRPKLVLRKRVTAP
jgi:hypothetical protein